MEAPIGYAALSPDEVIRRCELVISEVKADRKQKDDAMIADYVRRKKRWSFLPWWKPTHPEKAKEALTYNWTTYLSLPMFPSMFADRDMMASREFIAAARATSAELMWISVSMYFLSSKFE